MGRSSIVSFVTVVLVLGIFPSAGIDAQEPVSAQDTNSPGANAIPRGPNEVPQRIETDARPKEATFDFPAIDQFLQPWVDWKATVAEERGLRLGFDYQPVIQWSDNTVGEDSAAGGIFRAYTVWDMWSRDNPSRTGSLDVKLEHRHKIGTDLPPEALAPNFGYLGTTAPDWSDQGFGVTTLMLRQRLDVGAAPIELRAGYMSAFAQFDITMFSDNLTTFQNNSIILSPTIAYPSAGSFGVAGYVGIPRSKFYALGMIMDANGRYDSLSFDTLREDEYFSALEFGLTDQDLSGGAYVVNNVHVGMWHSDRRGKGAQLTGSYVFGESRIGVFGRLGWASDGASTIYEDYAAAGITKSVFRDSMIGLGVSWGRPQLVDVDQIATEVFYRWQMSQNFALTPSLQFLKNPALNPADDRVTVFGLRLRVTF